MIIDALVRPWLEVFHKPIVDWLREYGFDASDAFSDLLLFYRCRYSRMVYLLSGQVV
jgi:hypothetical protein